MAGGIPELPIQKLGYPFNNVRTGNTVIYYPKVNPDCMYILKPTIFRHRIIVENNMMYADVLRITCNMNHPVRS